MDELNKLLEITKIIENIYRKIITSEFEGNNELYEQLKEILVPFLRREEEQLSIIMKNDTTHIVFNDYIGKMSHVMGDFKIDVFDEANKQILIARRLLSKYLIKNLRLSDGLRNENINQELMKKLGIPNSKQNEATNLISPLSIMHMNETSKLTFRLVDKLINTNNYNLNQYNDLITFKNMLIFVNPVLEKAFLNNSIDDLKINGLIRHRENTGFTYTQIYDHVISSTLIEELNDNLSQLVTSATYNEYSCDKEISIELDLIGIKVPLILLDKEVLKEVNKELRFNLKKNSQNPENKNLINVKEKIMFILDNIDDITSELDNQTKK